MEVENLPWLVQVYKYRRVFWFGDGADREWREPHWEI